MKLLDQKQISRERAQENAQEIERGLKLARKVDDLRQKRVKEEQDFQNWRTESIKAITGEIDGYIARRDTAKAEATEAEERKFKANAPFDLQAEREKTLKQVHANERTADELLQRETRIIQREGELEITQKALKDEKEKTDRDYALAERLLADREIEYDKGKYFKVKAKQELDEAAEDIRERKEAVAVEEERVRLDRQNIENEKEGIEVEKMQIADEKLHIKSQQDTLKAAWDAYRKLTSK